MNIEMPEFLKKINRCFEKKGKDVYLVGGAVRNTLLGLSPNDFDISGAAKVKEIYRIFDGSDISIVPIAPEFGSVQLHVQNGTKREVVEYTTFRKDVYSAGGSHRPIGIEFSEDINCDAFRRDFSINAIYAHLGTGQIFDPTGGIDDIEKKLIKTSSKEPDKILKDDGLRVLRLVRFAAELGFEIEENTWESAKKHSNLLADIPVERIWKEMQKILLSDMKYDIKEEKSNPAHFRALEIMIKLDIMRYVFPELLEGKNIVQDPVYHAYDVMWHGIHSCKFSSPVLEWRLAALLHDVGKPRVFLKYGNMYTHDIIGEKMSREMLSKLKVKKSIIEDVSHIVRWHMYDLNNIAKESTIRKKFVQMGIEMVRGLIDIRRADFLGSGMQQPPIVSSERYKQILEKMIRLNVPFNVRDLNIDGDEIMKATNTPPSAKIGKIQHKLLLHCAVRPQDNVKSRLEKISKMLSNHIE